MTIRRGGVVAVLALAMLAPSVVAGAQAPPVQQRPNIVVIMTDDMDLAALETMPKTRDLIGAAGTTFTDAFVSDSLCCPSRATLLTGQYDHNHGVLHNSGDNGGYQALDHSNTLPVWLQGAGYATAHVGKYLNGIQGGQLPAGWTEWYTPTGTDSYQGVRSQHWLYVEYRYGERELYDLRSDPYQLRSLHDAPAHRQQLLFMQDKLDRLSGCSGPTCQSRTIRP